MGNDMTADSLTLLVIGFAGGVGFLAGLFAGKWFWKEK